MKRHHWWNINHIIAGRQHFFIFLNDNQHIMTMLKNINYSNWLSMYIEIFQKLIYVEIVLRKTKIKIGKLISKHSSLQQAKKSNSTVIFFDLTKSLPFLIDFFTIFLAPIICQLIVFHMLQKQTYDYLWPVFFETQQFGYIIKQ